MKHERDAYEDTQPQVHSQVCSLFSLHHVEPPRNLHHMAADVRKLRLWLQMLWSLVSKGLPRACARTGQRAGGPGRRSHSPGDIRTGTFARG